MMTGMSVAGGSLKLECRTYTGTEAPMRKEHAGSALMVSTVELNCTSCRLLYLRPGQHC